MQRYVQIFFAILLLAVIVLVGTALYRGSGLPTIVWPDWTLDGEAVKNILYALLVGAMGAWAFLLGVYTGFISRTDRPKVLEFLIDPLGQPRIEFVACFIFTGGVVASVFQAAQADTFAPIQAFVLGATWPSVVTRIMSGEGAQPSGFRGNPADTPANQVPRPRGATGVGDAEVTL